MPDNIISKIKLPNNNVYDIIDNVNKGKDDQGNTISSTYLPLTGGTITGDLEIQNTTVSSSSSTGALIVGGGAGINGDVNIGGILSVGDEANTKANLHIGTAAQDFRVSSTTGTNQAFALSAIVVNTNYTNRLEHRISLIPRETGLNLYDHTSDESIWSLTLPISILNGGTGATTAPAARAALGITPENIGALDTSGGTVSGQLILSKTTDISGTASSGGALIIGTKTGAHLAFDPNEIMAKSNDTTPTNLNINIDGGNITLGQESTDYFVKVQSTTASTNPSTGALVVGGGIGVAKNIYCGGDLYLYGISTSGDQSAQAIVFGLNNNATRTVDDTGTYTYYEGLWNQIRTRNRYKLINTSNTTSWSQARFEFRSYSATANAGTRAGGYESFFLPGASDGIDNASSSTYYIITTKPDSNTNVTNQKNARTNLGAPAKIYLTSDDTTAAKINPIVSVLQIGEAATFYALAAAMKVLTGNSNAPSCSGTITRTASTTYRVFASNISGATIWSFSVTISSSAITPAANIYMYTGTKQ